MCRVSAMKKNCCAVRSARADSILIQGEQEYWCRFYHSIQMLVYTVKKNYFLCVFVLNTYIFRCALFTRTNLQLYTDRTVVSKRVKVCNADVRS